MPEIGEKSTEIPVINNFNRMEVAFFRCLGKKEDAYFYGAFMRWLINYNKELGGSLKKLHPTVHAMTERVIW